MRAWTAETEDPTYPFFHGTMKHPGQERGGSLCICSWRPRPGLPLSALVEDGIQVLSSGHLGGFRVFSPRAPNTPAFPRSLDNSHSCMTWEQNGHQVAPAARLRAS